MGQQEVGGKRYAYGNKPTPLVPARWRGLAHSWWGWVIAAYAAVIWNGYHEEPTPPPDPPAIEQCEGKGCPGPPGPIGPRGSNE